MPGRIGNAHGTRRCRGDRRVLHRAYDVAGQLAPVERAHALPAEQAVGRGEIGVAEGRADRGRRPAGQIQRAGRAELRERGEVLGDLVDERLVDREAPVGDLDRRPQRVAQGAGAPLPQRGLPGRGVPGTPTEMPLTRASWKRTAARWRGRRTRSAASSPARPPGRRSCAPSGAGVVVDEEAATADTGRERLGDAQRGRGRDGGVDGVAAMPQHVQGDSVASMSTVAAAPPRPTATGALVTGGVACAVDPFTSVPARATTISTDNAVLRRTIITPPGVRHHAQPPDYYNLFPGRKAAAACRRWPTSAMHRRPGVSREWLAVGEKPPTGKYGR